RLLDHAIDALDGARLEESRRIEVAEAGVGKRGAELERAQRVESRVEEVVVGREGVEPDDATGLGTAPPLELGPGSKRFGGPPSNERLLLERAAVDLHALRAR